MTKVCSPAGFTVAPRPAERAYLLFSGLPAVPRELHALPVERGTTGQRRGPIGQQTVGLLSQPAHDGAGDRRRSAPSPVQV